MRNHQSNELMLEKVTSFMAWIAKQEHLGEVVLLLFQ